MESTAATPARQAVRPPVNRLTPIEADDDPHRLARLFFEAHSDWRRWPRYEIAPRVNDFIRSVFLADAIRRRTVVRKVTTSLVGDVLAAMRAIITAERSGRGRETFGGEVRR